MNFNEVKAYLYDRLATIECIANTYVTALEYKVNLADFDALSESYYDSRHYTDSASTAQGVSAVWSELSDVYERLEALEEAVRRLQQPNQTTIESLL